MRLLNCVTAGILAICLWSSELVFAAEKPGTAETGADLLPVFARTANGAPLRLVLMGGSIGAGSGIKCWTGEWLRQQFPGSVIVTHNAALSGHDSGDNLFRLEREVIAQQPDLVILEHVANDVSGQPDEGPIRNMESMIVRLKTLLHPPAIVYIEVAMREKDGPSRARLRQRRVSDYYQLS
jgi:hypothetical protein